MMHTYKIKAYKGVNDLQNIYAWTGGSQGDESFTNNVKENHEWMIYNFKDIDKNDQEAINIESARRKEENENYIQKLKEIGKYKEEYEINIHMMHNPLFDRPNQPVYKAESSKLIFIND